MPLIKVKDTQAWHFFEFFCRNRNLMVPRACNTRFLKIVFDGRDIQIVNISAYAQPAIKSILRMLIQRWKSFLVCSVFLVCPVCDKNVSAYAPHAHAKIFKLKCKFRLWKIEILKNRLCTFKSKKPRKMRKNENTQNPNRFLAIAYFTRFWCVLFRNCQKFHKGNVTVS